MQAKVCQAHWYLPWFDDFEMASRWCHRFVCLVLAIDVYGKYHSFFEFVFHICIRPELAAASVEGICE